MRDPVLEKLEPLRLEMRPRIAIDGWQDGGCLERRNWPELRNRGSEIGKPLRGGLAGRAKGSGVALRDHVRIERLLDQRMNRDEE